MSDAVDERIKAGVKAAEALAFDAAFNMVDRHVPEAARGVARVAVGVAVDTILRELEALFAGSGRVDVEAGPDAEVKVRVK